MAQKSGFCDLGFARIDIGRKKRRGFSEAVYAPGKDKQQIEEIIRALVKKRQDVLITRLPKPVFSYLKKSFPRLKFNPKAKLGFLDVCRKKARSGLVLVICAGTSDIAVAEEAAATAEVMGNYVKRLYDVGVAGVHRIVKYLDLLRQSKVIIVAAGMEGALASLVSGLVNCPVIAVPTSCGYGASFKGLSALLTMLNSCSPGVAVVNIDNGFGAGYFAALVNK